MAPTGWIFTKFNIGVFFKKTAEKIQVSLKSDKNNSTLHQDHCAHFIISRSVLLRMRNVSDKNCRENQKHFFVQ